VAFNECLQVQHADQSCTFSLSAIGEKVLIHPQEIVITYRAQLETMLAFLPHAIEELEKHIAENQISCAEDHRGDGIGELSVTGQWRGDFSSLSIAPINASRPVPLSFSGDASSLHFAEKVSKAILAKIGLLETAVMIKNILYSQLRVKSKNWALKGRNWPKISVVLPSFNQAAFVRQALDSIFEQKYPNLETIVLDPGSSDGTRKILAEYKDKISTLILEPDKGQSDALERGLNLAQGEILTWLCTDDMLEPDSLFRVAEAFLRHKTDVVVGGCRRIDETGRELLRHYAAMPFNQVVPLNTLGMMDVVHGWQAGHFFYQPEVFFTRDIWRRAGAFFHESAFYGMDYDLWVRMALAGGRGIQISDYIAASRAQLNQKTDLSQSSFLWQFANFLRHYYMVITTAVKLQKNIQEVGC